MFSLFGHWDQSTSALACTTCFTYLLSCLLTYLLTYIVYRLLQMLTVNMHTQVVCLHWLPTF